MEKENVIHYNFKGQQAEKHSSPPTDGVKISITRHHGNVKVVTNLTDLSETELLWALINDAAYSLQRENTVNAKKEAIREYITN